MIKRDDFLFEILTEELPPRSLEALGRSLAKSVECELAQLKLAFTRVEYFASPRRLAVLITELACAQEDQTVERRGPAKSAAFDAAGQPSKALLGFLRGAKATQEDLITLKTDQGEWVAVRQHQPGQSTATLMPKVIEHALNELPIPKRMYWGEADVAFIRPVHGVIILYGENIIPAVILGCETGRVTRGHRFLSPDSITIPHASAYQALLASEGFVMANFADRRARIEAEVAACIKNNLADNAQASISSSLLDEITGLVEWPVAMCGHFPEKYLSLPEEILVSSMQDHQRYFPVKDDAGKLLPYFIAVSNIPSADSARVIHGYERVLKARLSDAAFFYVADQKTLLADRLPRLQHILFHKHLGTVYDKSERISVLAEWMASQTHSDAALAREAGKLAKADLTTDMVNEFPELQGLMGYYYARIEGLDDSIARALAEQYYPRFAGDMIAQNPTGQALAVADKIDTLTGIFGIGELPTGDKDPYALRRAAIGIIRTLIENNIALDLAQLVERSLRLYGDKISNHQAQEQVLSFIRERLRVWYHERGTAPDVYAAVAALNLTNLADIHQRVLAVERFKSFKEAEVLASANKRVSNILAKNSVELSGDIIHAEHFESDAERALAAALESNEAMVHQLASEGRYEQILLQLSHLSQPVDNFFDQVMVMCEDKTKRANRLLLLRQLRELFLRVADIALLQYT